MKKLLSETFKGIVNLRNSLYDNKILKTHQVKLPIICVGNVIVGGAGKTPLVKELASIFKDKNFNPIVLTRGYGGVKRGPIIVNSTDSFTDIGDEPLMLARTGLTVVVAKDRVKGARFIEEHKLGDIIILDDGYQHRRLHRNINILSFDVRNEECLTSIQGNLQLPLGLLREDINSALKRSNLLIASHRGPKVSADQISKFTSALKVNNFDGDLWIDKGQVVSPVDENRELPAQKVIAVSGIARPEGFSMMLNQLGYQVVEHIKLPDHAKGFVKITRDLKNRYPDFPIVCTEKDIVRVNLKDHLLDALYYLKADYKLTLNEKALNLILNCGSSASNK